jgi:hypothetical protein
LSELLWQAKGPKLGKERISAFALLAQVEALSFSAKIDRATIAAAGTKTG